MMSPDPPRETRDQDSASSSGGDGTGLPQMGPGEFIAVWDDDDDVMGFPDGPYELDIGGESESDFTDDDEDGHHPIQPHPNVEASSAGAEGDVVVEGSRARGHYQLLIPFPPSEIVPDPSEDEISDVNQIRTTENANVESESPNPSQMEDSTLSSEPITGGATSNLNEGENIKRDIRLTEESVETIKNVMKNFSLPNVPNWVAEDDWKHKLDESIETKDSSKK